MSCACTRYKSYYLLLFGSQANGVRIEPCALFVYKLITYWWPTKQVLVGCSPLVSTVQYYPSLPTVYLQSTVQYRQTVLYFLHYSTVPPTVGMGDLVTSKKQHKKRPEASQKPSLNAMKDAGCGMCGATCNVELKLKLVHQTTAILHQYHRHRHHSSTTNKKIQQANNKGFTPTNYYCDVMWE